MDAGRTAVIWRANMTEHIILVYQESSDFSPDLNILSETPVLLSRQDEPSAAFGSELIAFAAWNTPIRQAASEYAVITWGKVADDNRRS
jgi:hypothetical protein